MVRNTLHTPMHSKMNNQDLYENPFESKKQFQVIQKTYFILFPLRRESYCFLFQRIYFKISKLKEDKKEEVKIRLPPDDAQSVSSDNSKDKSKLNLPVTIS